MFQWSSVMWPPNHYTLQTYTLFTPDLQKARSLSSIYVSKFCKRREALLNDLEPAVLAFCLIKIKIKKASSFASHGQLAI
jgi:hypothetical protein